MEQRAGRRELAGLVRIVRGGGAGMGRAADVSDCVFVRSRNCGFSLPETTSRRKEIKLKENKK